VNISNLDIVENWESFAEELFNAYNTGRKVIKNACSRLTSQIVLANLGVVSDEYGQCFHQEVLITGNGKGSPKR
jgi:hypothetical protein